jgi:hypothetical protein
MRKEDQAKATPDEELVDEYLDCAGKKRQFRLRLYGEGRFLEAVEVRRVDREGLRFVLPVKAGEVPPWGEMRQRIRERLAQRHVVVDATGELQVLHSIIRGQLTDGDPEEEVLSVVVDDLLISWEQLGQLLRQYSGFGLRLQIHEPGEE